MSLQVEKLEKNMAKLTIEVDAAKLDDAIKKAYEKNKGKMNVPGFRKGKVPQAMIEKIYGPGVFYEDAANFLIPEAYGEEVDKAEDLEYIENEIGIRVNVTLVEPKSIPRSEGKAVRVIDKRNFD